MHVSIAICTWNRADLLDRTLARMRELRIPNGISWELLVVDNNSSDSTPDIINEHLGKLPIRMLLEKRQGLANARNCALENAKGDLLLWTDDDVLVDPNWLAAYVEAAQAYPTASYFGGPVQPWFQSEPPRWIANNLDLLQGPFALRELGSETRAFEEGEMPFGANMAFRTAELRAVGFDRRLGRIGNAMLSGEETTAIYRMRDGGGTGMWVGPARVRHFIPTERMTVDYVWKFFHGLGRTRQLLSPFNRSVPLLGSGPRWIWRRYLLSRARALLCGPVKCRWWVKNFTDAAVQRGILDECRTTIVPEIAIASSTPVGVGEGD